MNLVIIFLALSIILMIITNVTVNFQPKVYVPRVLLASSVTFSFLGMCFNEKFFSISTLLIFIAAYLALKIYHSLYEHNYVHSSNANVPMRPVKMHKYRCYVLWNTFFYIFSVFALLIVINNSLYNLNLLLVSVLKSRDYIYISSAILLILLYVIFFITKNNLYDAGTKGDRRLNIVYIIIQFIIFITPFLYIYKYHNLDYSDKIELLFFSIIPLFLALIIFVLQGIIKKCIFKNNIKILEDNDDLFHLFLANTIIFITSLLYVTSY